MAGEPHKISLQSAALIAGLAILAMAIAAPFAELYVYPKLVIPNNVLATVKNILTHQTLFASAIFAYAITFSCDVVAAWALYLFLKPANVSVALLMGWFRLIFAAVAIFSLLNLVTVFRLLTTPDYLTLFRPEEMNAQVMLFLVAFRSGFHFAILFFIIHLGLLGYLVIISGYVPKIFGVLLIVSGMGYLITTLKPFLFANLNTDFVLYTFYGELIFMLWLLIKGWRIQTAA
jgi:hypothetical protein